MRIRFSTTDRKACTLKPRCTRAPRRLLTPRRREEHAALEAARAREAERLFADEYAAASATGSQARHANEPANPHSAASWPRQAPPDDFASSIRTGATPILALGRADNWCLPTGSSEVALVDPGVRRSATGQCVGHDLTLCGPGLRHPGVTGPGDAGLCRHTEKDRQCKDARKVGHGFKSPLGLRQAWCRGCNRDEARILPPCPCPMTNCVGPPREPAGTPPRSALLAACC